MQMVLMCITLRLSLGFTHPFFYRFYDNRILFGQFLFLKVLKYLEEGYVYR